MRKTTLLLFQIPFCIVVYSQPKVKELNPELGDIPAITDADQQLMNRRDVLLAKVKPTAKEQEELDRILEKVDETKESIWEVMGGSCSWYCGGGPYKIFASSSLPTEGGAEYPTMHTI